MTYVYAVDIYGGLIISLAFENDNDAKAFCFDVITDKKDYFYFYGSEFDKDRNFVIVLKECEKEEMPELSNIKECMEEFFDYADSCGVGALL